MKTRSTIICLISVIAVGCIGQGVYVLSKKTSFHRWVEASKWGSYWSTLFAPQEGKPLKPAILKQSPNETYRKGVLKEATLRKSNEIQECYQSFLRENIEPSEGKVKLSWMIEGDGQISDISLVNSEIGTPDFHNCIVEKLGSIKFAPPPTNEGTLISYTFKFYKRSPASLEFE